MTSTPVVCIDGPSGAGKGTLAMRLAKHCQWHLLDSGALYRVVGKACLNADVAWTNEEGAAAANKCKSINPSADKNIRCTIASHTSYWKCFAEASD